MVTSENISSDRFSPPLSAIPWPKPPSSLTRIITCQLPTVNWDPQGPATLWRQNQVLVFPLQLSIPLEKALHDLGLVLIDCVSPYAPQLHQPPCFSPHAPGKLGPHGFIRLPETLSPQTVSGLMPLFKTWLKYVHQASDHPVLILCINIAF